MAAVLKARLGVDAKLELGPSGSFEVRVAERIVASRNFSGFPDDDDVVAAVFAAVGG